MACVNKTGMMTSVASATALQMSIELSGSLFDGVVVVVVVDVAEERPKTKKIAYFILE
jgi:hypothetical protein